MICYFSAGSHENWRTDVGSVPSGDLGLQLEGWPGERWWNITCKIDREWWNITCKIDREWWGIVCKIDREWWDIACKLDREWWDISCKLTGSGWTLHVLSLIHI